MGVYSGLAVCEAARRNNIAVATESVNPIQFSIDLERADLALFESLAAIDIADIYMENGIISVNEADVANGKQSVIKTIINKIKELLTKLKNLIVKFFNTIKEKAQQIFQSDKKLYEKYRASFNSAEAKDCDLTGLPVVKIKKEEELHAISALDSNDGNLSDIVDKYLSAFDKFDKKSTVEEQLKAVLEDCEKFGKEYAEGCTNKYEAASKLLDDLVEIVKEPIGKRTNYLKEVSDNIATGRKNGIASIKLSSDAEQKEIDMIKNKIGQSNLSSLSTYKSSLDGTDLDKERATLYNASIKLCNGMYNVCAVASSTTSKLLNVKIKAFKKAYAAERNVFIQVSNWVEKSKKAAENKAATTDAATAECYSWALGEASDAFVESVFEA